MKLQILILSILILAASGALNAVSCNNPIDNAPCAADSASTIYTFASSQTVTGQNAINITALDVVLDCNGSSITGNGAAGTYGIYTNQSSTVVSNCNITNFASGIYVAAGGNLTFGGNNTFNGGASQSGVNLAGAGTALNCNGYALLGNMTNSTTYLGVTTASANVNITNCAIREFATTISTTGANTTINNVNASKTNPAFLNCQVVLISGTGAIINNSNVTLNLATPYAPQTTTHAIAFTASNGQVLNTVVYDDGYSGISATSAANNITVTNATIYVTSVRGGIAFSGANNTVLNANVISAIGSGCNIGATSTITNSTCQGGLVVGSGGNATNIETLQSGTGGGCPLTGDNIRLTNVSCGTDSSSSGDNVTMENSSFLCASVSGLTLTGTGALIANNTFTCTSTSSTRSPLNVGGTRHTLRNNLINVSPGTAGGYGMKISNGSSNFTGNTFISKGRILRVMGVVQSDRFIGNIFKTTGTSAIFDTPVANSTNFIFANNTFNFTGTSVTSNFNLISFTNSTFINNTFISSVAPIQGLINLDVDSNGNGFYWNNISATTIAAGRVLLNDTNGTNFYNTTEGNIWQDVMNGTVAITGTTPSSGFPALYIGNAGAVPYNQTNSNVFSCNFNGCGDYAPLTPFAGGAQNTSNLTVNCGVGLICTGNATNFAVPANKTITATASVNYTFSNFTVISGSCTINNSFSNNTFAIFGASPDNCIINASANYTPIIVITETIPSSIGDVFNGSLSTVSSVYSGVESFNFTPFYSTPTSFFCYNALQATATTPDTVTGQWRININSTEGDAANKTFTNNQVGSLAQVTPFFLGNNASSITIGVQQRRIIGGATRTIITRNSNTICFGTRDLITGASLDFNETERTGVITTSYTAIMNLSINMTSTGYLLLFMDRNNLKITSANVTSYTNITLSNGTVITTPTVNKFMNDGTYNPTGTYYFTNVSIPAGVTNITMWAKTSAGSVNFSGEIAAMSYHPASPTKINSTGLAGSFVNSSALSSMKNITIEIINQSKSIFAAVSMSGIASVGNATGTTVIDIRNSTGQIPTMMVTTEYPVQTTYSALNQEFITIKQRDFRNLTPGNYTLYLNESISSGNLTITDGFFGAFVTGFQASTELPLTPEIFSPINTTYYQTLSPLIINYSNASNQFGAQIVTTNIYLLYPNGTFNKTIIANNSNNLNYSWDISNQTTGQWIIGLNVTDANGYVKNTTSEIFTILHAPANSTNMTSIAVYPTIANKTTNLVCNVSAVDAFSSSFNITNGSWTKNGLIIENFSYVGILNNSITTVANLTTGNFSKGDNISCQAIATGSSISDFAYASNVTIQNSPPQSASIDNYTDALVGHWFLLNASVLDYDGGNDIISANASTDQGTCIQYSNSTVGNIFYLSENCTGTSPGTPNVAIGFTDSSGSYAQTSENIHSFPDHMPTLSPPTVTTPPFFFNSTANCTSGTFFDIDGDVRGPGGLVIWYLNGGLSVLFTNPTTMIDIGAHAGDNVSCQITTNALIWTSSVATNISANVTLIKYNDTVSLLLNGSASNISYVFDPSFNLTASASAGSGANTTIKLNGTAISNPDSRILAAGTYNYTANSSGNIDFNNASTTLFANVSKAPGNLSISYSNVTFGTNVSVNCSANSPELNASLFRNGTLVGNPDTSFLAAGTYNYTCNASASQNYSAPSTVQINLTVGKATNYLNIYLNGSESNISYFYSPSFNLTVSANATNGSAVLVENGTVIVNPFSQVMPAGFFNFTANSTDNQNWTGQTKSLFANISKATPTVSLSSQGGFILQNGTQSNVSCSISNNQSFTQFFFNGSVIANSTANGTVMWHNATLSIGNFTYWCNASESQNYTSASATNVLQISTNASVFSQTNGPESQIAVATDGIPVPWQVYVYVNGSGTCNYSILKLAVQAGTTINDANGSAIANIGNDTVPAFACNDTASPYFVVFHTEPIIQTDQGSVHYAAIIESGQRRILISTGINQSISYRFNYSLTVPIARLYQCQGLNDSDCTPSSPWNAITFSYDGIAITKTFTIASNETVFVVAWEVVSQGTGGFFGGPQPNVTINQSQGNASLIQAAAVQPGFLEQVVAAMAGLASKFNAWASCSTSIGSISFGNWLLIDIILAVLILYTMVIWKSSGEKYYYVILALFFLFCLLFVTLKYPNEGGMCGVPAPPQEPEGAPITDQLASAASEVFGNLGAWAAGESSLGNLVFGNWILIDILLLVVFFLSAMLYRNKKEGERRQYLILAAMCVIGMLFFAISYGGRGI